MWTCNALWKRCCPPSTQTRWYQMIIFLVTCQYRLSKAGVMSSNWCIAGGGGCEHQWLYHAHIHCVPTKICVWTSSTEPYFYFYMQWYLQINVCRQIGRRVYIWKYKIILLDLIFWMCAGFFIADLFALPVLLHFHFHLQIFSVWVYYD